MPSDAAYYRRWRAARPESVKRAHARQRAYGRALVRTAEHHSRTFARYYGEECAAEGVEHIGLGGPGRPKQRLIDEAAS